MSWYREEDDFEACGSRSGILDEQSMLGSIDPAGNEYDHNADLELGEMLEDELKEMNKEEKPDIKGIISDFSTDDNREKFEDYYNEFDEDEVPNMDDIPNWYRKKLDMKIKETKSRLDAVSRILCWDDAAKAHIQRMERDHSSPLCKFDGPKFPDLKKPWINFWKFNCVTTCKEKRPIGHACSIDCEVLLMQHDSTGTTTTSRNILKSEFPQFVMHAVEVFEHFAGIVTKKKYEAMQFSSNKVEKPTWTALKLRSNYKRELMMIACGKAVIPLFHDLKEFFQKGPGRSTSVVSLFCDNMKWTQKKKNQHPPATLYGTLQMRDKVGPIKIMYDSKTETTFNSVEASQLGRTIFHLLKPLHDTTVLDIGCGFGAISLMLAHECERVIGVSPIKPDLDRGISLKKDNNLHNVSFVPCNAKDLLTTCAPIVKGSKSVALVNLCDCSHYGKSGDALIAVRRMPSVWRVIVYGSFSKDLKKLTYLTNSDESNGDKFLPMRACLLDKFPSVEKAFDILIVFERSSLIQNSVKQESKIKVKSLKPESIWDSTDTGSKHELECISNGEASPTNTSVLQLPTVANGITPPHENRLQISQSDAEVPSTSYNWFQYPQQYPQNPLQHQQSHILQYPHLYTHPFTHIQYPQVTSDITPMSFHSSQSSQVYNEVIPTHCNLPLPNYCNPPLPADCNPPLPTGCYPPLPTDCNPPLPTGCYPPLPTDCHPPLPTNCNPPLPPDSNTSLPTEINRDVTSIESSVSQNSNLMNNSELGNIPEIRIKSEPQDVPHVQIKNEPQDITNFDTQNESQNVIGASIKTEPQDIISAPIKTEPQDISGDSIKTEPENVFTIPVKTESHDAQIKNEPMDLDTDDSSDAHVFNAPFTAPIKSEPAVDIQSMETPFINPMNSRQAQASMTEKITTSTGDEITVRSDKSYLSCPFNNKSLGIRKDLMKEPLQMNVRKEEPVIKKERNFEKISERIKPVDTSRKDDDLRELIRKREEIAKELEQISPPRVTEINLSDFPSRPSTSYRKRSRYFSPSPVRHRPSTDEEPRHLHHRRSPLHRRSPSHERFSGYPSSPVRKNHIKKEPRSPSHERFNGYRSSPVRKNHIKKEPRSPPYRRSPSPDRSNKRKSPQSPTRVRQCSKRDPRAWSPTNFNNRRTPVKENNFIKREPRSPTRSSPSSLAYNGHRRSRSKEREQSYTKKDKKSKKSKRSRTSKTPDSSKEPSPNLRSPSSSSHQNRRNKEN